MQLLLFCITLSSCTAQPDGNALEFLIVPLKFADAEFVAEKIQRSLDTDAEIVVDKRTNSFEVCANAATIQKVEKIVKRLDVRSYLSIVKVKRVSASSTAKTLSAVMFILELLGDDRDIAISSLNPTDNAIIICASEEKIVQVKAMLHRLDVQVKE